MYVCVCVCAVRGIAFAGEFDFVFVVSEQNMNIFPRWAAINLSDL